MPDLAEVAVKAAEKIISGAVGAVGSVAGKINSVLKIVDSQVEKAIRNEAREILGCEHIVVCPKGTFNSRMTDMIDYVKQTSGMAFVYGGVALGHRQRDFDVKRVSTQVVRATTYDKTKKEYGFTDEPLHEVSMCWECFNKRVGGAVPEISTGYAPQARP